MATVRKEMVSHSAIGNASTVAAVLQDAFRSKLAERRAADSDIPSWLHSFVRTLKEPKRDFMNRLLPSGTKVLCSPANEGVIFEYTEDNRRTQMYADLLSSVRYPPMERWPEDVKATIQNLVSHRQEFCSKIEANLSDLTVRQVTDFSVSLFDAILEANGTEPVAGTIPDSWYSEIKRCFSARLFRIKQKKLFADEQYLALVFATPFDIDTDSGMRVPVSPDGRFLDIVLNCVHAVYERYGGHGRLLVTLGSGLDWVSAPAVWATDKECLVTGVPADDGWQIVAPDIADKALAAIIKLLMPITNGEFLQQVHAVVKKMTAQYPTGVSVADVCSEMNKSCVDVPKVCMCMDSVVRALLDIQAQDQSPYTVCKRKGEKTDIFVMRKENFCAAYDEPIKR